MHNTAHGTARRWFVCCLWVVASPTTCGADTLHWSFRPLPDTIRPAAPPSEWAAHPIDVWVWQQLHAAGLKPSPPADRAQLIRRVTISLTGLPPTHDEVTGFVNDPSPTAYPELVDRLLASPAYGERVAQHWLDVVRYADSDGFEYDDPRPAAWRYRDWVIESFNQDRPYAEFIRWQVAGDLLGTGQLVDSIPTALHRLGPLRKNAGNQFTERDRQEFLVQATDAIGFAFLGLTVGCAKCHDHKFDPISQDEYYSMQAFFEFTEAVELPIAGPHEAQARKDEPVDLSQTIMAVHDRSDSVAPTFVLRRGEPGQHMHPVGPRFPQVLADFAEARMPSTGARRLQLANWLASPDHPLTARVLANRIWQHHFGQGLARRANDLGAQGGEPSHPPLLDWLARELVRSDWSIKHVQRLIVTSHTFQQSSRMRDKAHRVDPNNRLVWRVPLRRMDAETIRDATLAVSGQLVRDRGGPGVRLRLSKEVSSMMYKGTWRPNPRAQDQARRSIYRFVKRNLRPSLFTAFDAPDTLVSCAQRPVSIHAGQALTLLNSDDLERQAAALATQITRDVGRPLSVNDHDRHTTRLFQRVLSRRPEPRELQLASAFLHQQMTTIRQENPPASSAQVAHAALTDLTLAVLNLDEFLHY